jgi:3-(3-hydroxy-phenyl)propionate hydroxylase
MNGRVIVAGAGPAGCTAALALAQRGIPVLLLEREARLPAAPRAWTVHPSSLDLLDTIGVAERIVPLGLDAPVYQYRDRASGDYVDFDFGVLRNDTRFPMRLQCEQDRITRAIVAMLAELPHAEVRFGVEVTDVLPDAAGVTLCVRDGDGRVDLVHAAFALACDGAASTIRKRLGIAFDGSAPAEKFVSLRSPVDLAAALPGLANVSYIADGDAWCALGRVVGAWRIVVPADSATDDDALLADANVQRLLQTFVGQRDVEIGHRAVYRVQQRVAQTFHRGRVLLAGDAAHVNNPLGGMGLNSGLHDAFNAAGKLARILIGGESPEPLLAQYTRQRRMVALEYVEAANRRSKRLLDERDPAARRVRFAELRAIAADPARARDYLRRSTLYESLERANAVA